MAKGLCQGMLLLATRSLNRNVEDFMQTSNLDVCEELGAMQSLHTDAGRTRAVLPNCGVEGIEHDRGLSSVSGSPTIAEAGGAYSVPGEVAA